VLLKTIISISVFLFLFISENRGQSSIIKHVDVYFKLPFLESKENPEEYNIQFILDSFSIFYNNNFILYKFPYTYIEQQNDKIEKIEVKYTYFIFKNGSKYGYQHVPAKPDLIEKLAVDSIINKNAFGNVDLFFDSGYQKGEVYTMVDNFHLIEKYNSIQKPGKNFPDTVIYYYSEQCKDLPFSLSKKLEEKRKLKVLMIKGVFNSRFDEETKITFPKREFNFELKPHDTMLDNFVLYVFNLYEK
jgi:hypothetical protein